MLLQKFKHLLFKGTLLYLILKTKQCIILFPYLVSFQLTDITQETEGHNIRAPMLQLYICNPLLFGSTKN